MCLRKKTNIETKLDSKFKKNDYVDFWYKDDIYFGHISDVKLDKANNVIYDIDVAGQCPIMIENIKEEKVVRIHK